MRKKAHSSHRGVCRRRYENPSGGVNWAHLLLCPKPIMARNTLLFKGGALRQLKHGARRTGGRNNLGRITAYHRGGGAKRSFRDIDMKRSTAGMVGTVERIEYDPFRTGRTALIRWGDGDDFEAGPVASPRRNGGGEGHVGASKIVERRGKRFPRGIHDVSRRELRSAVATICGVSLSDVDRNRRSVKVVTVDGRRKFSSSSGIAVALSNEEEQLLPGTGERCEETGFGEYILRKFLEMLNINKTL